VSFLDPCGALFDNRRINLFDILANPLIFLGLVKRPDRDGADPSSKGIMGLEDEDAGIGFKGEDVDGLKARDASANHDIIKYVWGL
jgi:hypothetical protein